MADQSKTETWVYTPEGQRAFHRVRNNVYRGRERVFYIDGNTVCDQAGVPRYYLAPGGIWWFSYSNVASYYQEHEVVSGDEE